MTERGNMRNLTDDPTKRFKNILVSEMGQGKNAAPTSESHGTTSKSCSGHEQRIMAHRAAYLKHLAETQAETQEEEQSDASDLQEL